MQVHIDPLGGWSGDMFVAAVLDAFPDRWPLVQEAIAGLGLGEAARCRLADHDDGALTGRRFIVEAEPRVDAPADARAEHHEPSHHHHHDHDHHHRDDHHHDHPHHDEAAAHTPHRHWSDIRAMLRRPGILPAGVADHAVGIFALLAEAEAAVHGRPVEAVAFHEVGAVDSIVDIVAAAVLIHSLGASLWTSAPLPLGSGRVRSAHGLLPVPAPATALLLRGLETLDDGIGGERVTPTGAAVARYLLGGRGSAPPRARRLVATGTGFGTRRLPGIANCLRVLAFDEEAPAQAPADAPYGHRELAVITFEVDDQSAEDLGHGLDHVRAVPGVHDVMQAVAFGKKGRMTTQVQVLVAPEALEDAIAACFTETTTIGLRYHRVQGAALRRRAEAVSVDGGLLRIKAVERPGGLTTAKTEADDVAALPGHAARLARRRAGEAAALGPGATTGGRNGEDQR